MGRIDYIKIILHRLKTTEVEGTEFVKQAASNDVDIGLSTYERECSVSGDYGRVGFAGKFLSKSVGSEYVVQEGTRF
jgi:hypothetical protein